MMKNNNEYLNPNVEVVIIDDVIATSGAYNGELIGYDVDIEWY